MMRNLAFISVTMVLVWPAVYFAIPGLGYPLQLWAIITSASISAIFAGSIVLLGESIIEDIVLVGILLLLTTALGFAAPKIKFIFVCVIIAGLVGIVMSHINQFVANKVKPDALKRTHQHGG
jgi:hypothetical protein